MTRYVLHPDCRVRKEEFGLLFYDLRGPKLLFVACGALLGPEFFLPGSAPERALAGRSRTERLQVDGLLRSLAVKGFLLEQSIC